jgi:presenilin-like A22 family membrane protease
MRREIVSTVAMACSIVISQSVALLLAPFFIAAGATAFPDPNNAANPIIYVILILAFTALILFIVKKRRENILKYIILGSMFLSMIFVFYIPALFGLYPFVGDLAFNLALVLSLVVSGILTFALFKYPEWYVVDAVGISVAAGVTAIMGISFTIFPTLILLILLAVYDAISVYKTKHMVTLADAVAAEKLPILLVIPKKLDYSYKDQESIKKQISSGEEREAMFMGLGDMIIPGVLVVSALASNADKLSTLVFGIPGPLIVSIGTLIGGLVGFAVLMKFVMKGNPQAGLPLLNSGVIMGYFVTYYLVFQELSFGIRLGWF